MAKKRQHAKNKTRTKRTRKVRSLPSISRSSQLPSLTMREKNTRARALHLLLDLRHGKGSYSRLLRKHRLNTRTARKYLGRNLLGGTRGRPVYASKTDALVRERLFPTSFGDVPRLIRGSKTVSKLSEYFNDRAKLLRGKVRFAAFESKWQGVSVEGEEVFADAAEIVRMANAGELKVEDFYSPPGGAK